VNCLVETTIFVDMIPYLHKIDQHNTRQNNARQTFMVLNNFWSYTTFCGQKATFVFLDNL